LSNTSDFGSKSKSKHETSHAEWSEANVEELKIVPRDSPLLVLSRHRDPETEHKGGLLVYYYLVLRMTARYLYLGSESKGKHDSKADRYV